ncbi:agamous-like MADS-box protein AGL66 [Solanum lycopersicum]|uniref:agamous-like MADS-box protein AGL66 n=1 Tax=Solanum lycopersicum TaxID=4081 RepID=UPI0002BC9C1A
MDRNKIMIKIIEDPISRQQFYSKCKDSIVKKSNELGLLCDTNIALLMVSPNGEVTSCSGGESFEDIMSNAMNQFDELNRHSYEPQAENINTVEEADAYEQYLLGAIGRIQLSKAKFLDNQEFLKRNENVARI